MKPLFDWLRAWRQPKSSKADDFRKPSSVEHMGGGDLHIHTFSLNKGCHNPDKPHHGTRSPPIALPATGHHYHHHHLIKSCRVMPLMTADGDAIDDDDVDIEFSTMMMASFTTVAHPLSHPAPHSPLTSTTTFSTKRATMPHSNSMPKARHAASCPCSPHLPPRHSVEGSSCIPHPVFTPQAAPVPHSPQTRAKKSSRMPHSPLLRVLAGRPAPPMPDSPSSRPLPIPRSPSTHASSRRPPSSPMSSTAQAKDRPRIPQSPSTRTKGSSKTIQSPSIRQMAYPSSTPDSPSTRASERVLLHSPSQKATKGAQYRLKTSLPLIHPSSGLADSAPKAPARTYQPVCCSSGKCILDCHEVSETTKKAEPQPAQKMSQPKKTVKYGMTIQGSRGGRRLSFKNGKWITDDSDYVVLEL